MARITRKPELPLSDSANRQWNNPEVHLCGCTQHTHTHKIKEPSLTSALPVVSFLSLPPPSSHPLAPPPTTSVGLIAGQLIELNLCGIFQGNLFILGSQNWSLGGGGGRGEERVEKERKKKKEEKEEKGSGKRSLPVIEILTAGISPRRVSTVCHLSVFCGPH